MDDFNKFVDELTETIFNVAILMGLIFCIVVMIGLVTLICYAIWSSFGEIITAWET